MTDRTPEADPVYEQVEMKSGDAEISAWMQTGFAELGQTLVFNDAEWIVTKIYPFTVTEEQLLRMPRDARTSTTLN